MKLASYKFTAEFKGRKEISNKINEIVLKRTSTSKVNSGLSISKINSVLLELRDRIREDSRFHIHRFCSQYIAYREILLTDEYSHVLAAVILKYFESLLFQNWTKQIILKKLLKPIKEFEKLKFSVEDNEKFDYVVGLLLSMTEGEVLDASNPDITFFANTLVKVILSNPVSLPNHLVSLNVSPSSQKFNGNLYQISYRLKCPIVLYTFKANWSDMNNYSIIYQSDIIDIDSFSNAIRLFNSLRNSMYIMYGRKESIKYIDANITNTLTEEQKIGIMQKENSVLFKICMCKTNSIDAEKDLEAQLSHNALQSSAGNKVSK